MATPMQLDPTSRLCEVTPGLAAKWLALNTSNRTLNKRAIAKFAKQMQDGKWHLTGSPIQFNTHGDLVDGQHRLSAIIQSGVTIKVFVTKGLDSEAKNYIDLGSKRTVGDQLVMSGVRHATTIAGAARILCTINMATGERAELDSGYLSEVYIREFIGKHPDIIESAQFCHGLHRDTVHMKPSVLCAAHYYLMHNSGDPTHVNQFFSDITESVTTGEGDPRRTLIKRLSQAREMRERIGYFTMLYMVVRCYNAYITHERFHRILLVQDGVMVNSLPRVKAARPRPAPTPVPEDQPTLFDLGK